MQPPGESYIDTLCIGNGYRGQAAPAPAPAPVPVPVPAPAPERTSIPVSALVLAPVLAPQGTKESPYPGEVGRMYSSEACRVVYWWQRYLPNTGREWKATKKYAKC